MRSRLLALAITAALTGCASAAPSAIGVRQGGAQDIGAARAQIQAGMVPLPDSFLVEGLYAEHDLPVADAAPGKTLGVALGVGQAPLLPAGKPATFIQVGMSSGIPADQLKRPKLQLVVVADRSGSMQGAKIAALRQALDKLVDQLTPDDQLAVLEFDTSVVELHGLANVTSKDEYKQSIAKIQDAGGTDIGAGLRRGFSMLEAAPAADGVEKRVVLLTDADPNEGMLTTQSFTALVGGYAAKHIGLTAFGVGLDFRAEIAEAIGHQEGGNYVYLESPEKLQKVFDQDFDSLMSPAAYDVDLSVTPAKGWKIAEAFGAKLDASQDASYHLNLKTLFFSKNRGALVLRLEPTGTPAAGEQAIAEGHLTYVERDHVTHRDDVISAKATGDLPAGQTRYFSPEPVRKAVALTNMYLGMKEAARLFQAGKKADATKVLAAAKLELQDAQTALKADDLATEIALVDKLSANIGR
jgi:Ca-activated chloride channel family protein